MRRKLFLAAALAMVASAFAARPGSAQTDPAFCNSALDVDRAFAALEDGTPKRVERDRTDAALTALEAAAPQEVAANVTSIVATVRDALAEKKDPAADRGFQRDKEAIDAYRYSSCGYQTADVTLLEYEFDGLPKTLTTGTVAIKLTNTGTEVHELALARLKSSSSFRKSLALPTDKQGKMLRYVAQELAPPDETVYMFVELTRPGRYGAACHIPVGTTSVDGLGAEEHGHGDAPEPHWQEGMLATFRVAAA